MIEIELGILILVFGTGFALGNLTSKALKEVDSE